MNAVPEAQLSAFAGLIQLERQARHAEDLQALGFLMVNETLAVAPYRQAVLWRADDRAVLAVSGLAMPEGDAPYVAWLRRVLPPLAADPAVRAVAAADLPETEARDWAEWLPAHGLWLPLAEPRGDRLGGLLLARDAPWTEAEAHLLAYLADAYAHAWIGLSARRRRRGRWWRRNRLALGLAALGLAAAWVPVRQSVLAPAEVVAHAPAVVRAPFDGVVDRFEVRPNQPVAAGQVLLALDPTRTRSRLEVARKAREVAEAEFRQAAQQAVFDAKAKASLALLQGRLEQHDAEVGYLENLLQRIELKAPRAGLAIFDDVNDWIGRPVATGERILQVAAPEDTELEIHLPVADAIALEPGAEVVLFLNIDPQNPVPARLERASYTAAVLPDGVLAYRLRARVADGGRPVRLGLKGTAKVYGRPTTLGYFVLRRPLAAVRQWLGWP